MLKKERVNYNMLRKGQRHQLQKGTSLIELMIAMAILAFVLVSVLTAFSQVQVNSLNILDKNAALMIAETRLEELSKFPANHLFTSVTVDYAYFKANGFYYLTANKELPRQFRRTVTITKDLLQQTATITVLVEYGYQRKSSTDKTMVYPFRLQLSTRRTLI